MALYRIVISVSIILYMPRVLGNFTGNRLQSAGMLRRPNGHVLKPATKAILGEREIAFYENLQTSQDTTTVQLKNFVPCYYGTTELRVFNKRKAFYQRPRHTTVFHVR